MSDCWLGVGGNVGDVHKLTDEACGLLDSNGVRIVRRSRFWQTQPIGAAAGVQEFLNAALQIETDLTPEDLLRTIHRVEDSLGRERGRRWGPRCIDIDLLLHGDVVRDDPDLQIPHPGVAYRMFVLDPLHEIAAGVTHPVYGRPIAELLNRLQARPLPVIPAGGRQADREKIRKLISAQFAGSVRIPQHGESVDATLFCLGDSTGEGHAADRTGSAIAVRIDRIEGPLVDAAEAVLTAMTDAPQAVD